MKVTIIIVSFNTREILRNCLQSIFDQQWKHTYQIVVVDNASTDGSVEMVKDQFLKARLIVNKENTGFAAANNQVLKQANDDYVLLLNSDTVVLPGALDHLVDQAEQNGFSIESCKLQDKNGHLQPNAGDIPTGIALFSWLSGIDALVPFLPTFHQNNPRFYSGTKEVGWVSGSVLMMNRMVLEAIKGFDQNIFMYTEDTDFCWRAQKLGYVVGWTDQAEIIHLGGASSNNPAYTQWLGEFKGLIYLYQKNYGYLTSIGLKWLVKLFIILRIVAFGLLGRRDIAKTYGKILSVL